MTRYNSRFSNNAINEKYSTLNIPFKDKYSALSIIFALKEKNKPGYETSKILSQEKFDTTHGQYSALNIPFQEKYSALSIIFALTKKNKNTGITIFFSIPNMNALTKKNKNTGITIFFSIPNMNKTESQVKFEYWWKFLSALSSILLTTLLIKRYTVVLYQEQLNN